VQDSGTGLETESLDHLFTAFFTTKPKGMGMGLAISRSIIEAHAGRLWASRMMARAQHFNSRCLFVLSKNRLCNNGE
jgi:C4-dicarboxylate-specific signal transduction histidine kinase